MNAVRDSQDGWRTVVAEAAKLGIPSPALSCALAFYDGYRTASLPANLIQVIEMFKAIDVDTIPPYIPILNELSDLSVCETASLVVNLEYGQLKRVVVE